MGSLTSHSIGNTRPRLAMYHPPTSISLHSIQYLNAGESFEAVVHFSVLLLHVSFFKIYRLSDYDSLSPKPLQYRI